jgi:hypothetical protein
MIVRNPGQAKVLRESIKIKLATHRDARFGDVEKIPLLEQVQVIPSNADIP